MDRDPFKEYIKESEPGKRDKGYVWHMIFSLKMHGTLGILW